jgi:uncharacterized protein
MGFIRLCIALCNMMKPLYFLLITCKESFFRFFDRIPQSGNSSVVPLFQYNPPMTPAMSCRPGCGACCTAPSISSAIPGMPFGKPAGVRCIQLDEVHGCRIFGSPARPAVCASLRPSVEMCGSSREQALAWLDRLEKETMA